MRSPTTAPASRRPFAFASNGRIAAIGTVPQAGARLKTSMWRRNPDVSIPSRAKVNGGYVNSVLAKQDALDSGYDDCILLDAENHVCELSAANIFIIRGGSLITPGSSSDILEGINRKTVIELARDMRIPVEERTIDVSELYIADEAFACGTSAFVAPGCASSMYEPGLRRDLIERPGATRSTRRLASPRTPRRPRQPRRPARQR